MMRNRLNSVAECCPSIINVSDHIYQIRNGTGIGVFSPAYGPRRAIYGGIKIPLTRASSP